MYAMDGKIHTQPYANSRYIGKINQRELLEAGHCSTNSGHSSAAV